MTLIIPIVLKNQVIEEDFLKIGMLVFDGPELQT